MPYYIDGTDWDDELRGTQYDDVISGYDGDDLIVARGGDDTLYGDRGDDDLVGGSGINDYFGGRGYDWFIMSDRGDGFSDDLILDFNFAFDQVDVSEWGVSDFSQIKALLGADSTGSATLNAYYAGRDHWLTIDDVFPGELRAIDFLYSDSGARDENGTQKNDVMFGSRSSDRLDGRAGHDEILGGVGNDRLLGGDGSDDLIGGNGADVLSGGGGFDSFVYASVKESPSGSNRDRISGFQTDADLIDVWRIDARTDQSGNQAFVWGGFSSEFSQPGELIYRYQGQNTILSGNIDRDDRSEFQILLTGRHALDAGDFVL